MAASERRAYVYWAVGGIFGLHHFYLGRDVQAFVWFMTFGGGIVGWLRDYRKIPKYVDEANGKTKDSAKKVVSDLETTLQGLLSNYLPRNRPKASWTLYIGQILLGIQLSVLFRFAIPDQLLLQVNILYRFALMVVTSVTGSAVGVYLASNISPYKVSPKFCISESAISWSLFTATADWSMFVTPFVIAHGANKELGWASKKVKKNNQNSAKRCLIAALLCLLYMSMFYVAVCHNKNFTTSTGSAGTLREVTSEYLAYYGRHGLWRLYEDGMRYIDPSSEYRAYWTLGVRTPWMSQSELKSHCRKLSAQWHPDRFFTDSEKLYAETKYQDIVNACDVLKKLK